MRGKEIKVPANTALTGITPACAGKSPRREPGLRAAGDHPRVCGEKIKFERGYNVKQGSPPRVRGKERQAAIDAVTAGITPACAGKSENVAAAKTFVQDHPRVCGEKTKESLKK